MLTLKVGEFKVGNYCKTISMGDKLKTELESLILQKVQEIFKDSDVITIEVDLQTRINIQGTSEEVINYFTNQYKIPPLPNLKGFSKEMEENLVEKSKEISKRIEQEVKEKMESILRGQE